MKHWVIPDLHGCYKTLKSLVENKIIPTKEDTITFLGDYIDRGPYSQKVIDYIMGLQKEFPNINCLRGNHEEYMIEAYHVEKNKKWLSFLSSNPVLGLWKSVGGDQTLKSFEVKKVSDIAPKYFEWLEALKYYVITENYIIVHAGLNFEIDDPFSDKLSMTTLRDFKVNSEKIGHRRIIHGHVPLSIEFIESLILDKTSPYIAIDNGCYHRNKTNMGSLLALEINTLTYVLQRNIDII